MPSEVRWFERLMYLQLVILTVDVARQPPLPPHGDTEDMILYFASHAAVVAVYGGLIYLTARRARNWARWLFLGLYVVALMHVVVELDHLIRFNPVSAGVEIVRLFLQITAFVLVFSVNARPYFQPAEKT